MLSLRLYLAQRLSALVMAPLVLLHLAVMIYAIQGGLDAAEILSRTRGSLFWGIVYELFVVAAAVHAAIGLRTVTCEWFGLRGRPLELFMWFVGLGVFVLGTRAVYAVVIA